MTKTITARIKAAAEKVKKMPSPKFSGKGMFNAPFQYPEPPLRFVARRVALLPWPAWAVLATYADGTARTITGELEWSTPATDHLSFRTRAAAERVAEALNTAYAYGGAQSREREDARVIALRTAQDAERRLLREGKKALRQVAGDPGTGFALIDHDRAAALLKALGDSKDAGDGDEP